MTRLSPSFGISLRCLAMPRFDVAFDHSYRHTHPHTDTDTDTDTDRHRHTHVVEVPFVST